MSFDQDELRKIRQGGERGFTRPLDQGDGDISRNRFILSLTSSSVVAVAVILLMTTGMATPAVFSTVGGIAVSIGEIEGSDVEVYPSVGESAGCIWDPQVENPTETGDRALPMVSADIGSAEIPSPYDVRFTKDIDLPMLAWDDRALRINLQKDSDVVPREVDTSPYSQPPTPTASDQFIREFELRASDEGVAESVNPLREATATDTVSGVRDQTQSKIYLVEGEEYEFDVRMRLIDEFDFQVEDAGVAAFIDWQNAGDQSSGSFEDSDNDYPIGHSSDVQTDDGFARVTESFWVPTGVVPGDQTQAETLMRVVMEVGTSDASFIDHTGSLIQNDGVTEEYTVVVVEDESDIPEPTTLGDATLQTTGLSADFLDLRSEDASSNLLIDDRYSDRNDPDSPIFTEDGEFILRAESPGDDINTRIKNAEANLHYASFETLDISDLEVETEIIAREDARIPDEDCPVTEPQFLPQILSVPQPGETHPGDTITVEGQVINPGDEDETQSLTLELVDDEGEVVDEDDRGFFTLEAGETRRYTEEWDTYDSFEVSTDETGRYEVRLNPSDDDYASEEVIVGDPPEFQVNITDVTPEVVATEDELVVEYEIENQGDVVGTQDIDLYINGTDQASEELVQRSSEQVEGGETVTRTISSVPADRNAGDPSDVILRSEDDNDTSTSTIWRSPDFDVEITELGDGTTTVDADEFRAGNESFEVDAVEEESLYVTSTVTNVGQAEDTQDTIMDIQTALGDELQEVDLESVTLDNRTFDDDMENEKQTEVTLSFTPDPEEHVPTIDAFVRTDDDRDFVQDIPVNGTGAIFQIHDLQVNETTDVDPGDHLNVTFDIENVGDEEGSDDIYLDIIPFQDVPLGQPGDETTYGVPDGDTSAGEYVDRVRFVDIDNPTGDDSGYASFVGGSDVSIPEIAPGDTLEIEVDSSTGGWTNEVYVWFDWDRSGEFTVDHRSYVGSVDDGGGDNDTTSTFVRVPEDAEAGETRMRVYQEYAASTVDDPTTLGFGEAEDYALVVQDQVRRGEQVIENLTLPAEDPTTQEDDHVADNLSFVYEVLPEDEPEFESQVRTEFDADSVLIDVNTPPEFEIIDSSVTEPDFTVEGDVLDVDFDVENIGSLDGEVEVTLDIDRDQDGEYEIGEMGAGQPTAVDADEYPPGNGSSGEENIENVYAAGGDIDRSSDANAYEDFTDEIAVVEPGDSFTLEVEVDADGNHPQTVGAWIDWDQSRLFDSGTTEYVVGSTEGEPHFTITSYSFNDSVEEGETLTATLTVENEGYAADDATMNFWVDETGDGSYDLVDSRTENLGEGEDTTVGLDWESTGGSPGTHDVFIEVVDSDNEVHDDVFDDVTVEEVEEAMIAVVGPESSSNISGILDTRLDDADYRVYEEEPEDVTGDEAANAAATYAALVINNFGSVDDADVQSLLDEVDDDTGVVHLENNAMTGGVDQRSSAIGDPDDTNGTFTDSDPVRMHVTDGHPLFAGVLQPGDGDVLDVYNADGYSDHAWWSGFSDGANYAEVGDADDFAGPGVGVTWDDHEVLLSLGQNGFVDKYFDGGEHMLANSVRYLTITAEVTNVNWDGYEVYPPGEGSYGADVTVENTGDVNHSFFTGFSTRHEPDDLQLYWEMDGFGDTTDISGESNNGTEDLEHGHTNADGVYDRAYRFEGGGSDTAQVDIVESSATASDLGIGGSNPRTVSVWFNDDVGTELGGGIFQVGSSDGQRDWTLRHAPGGDPDALQIQVFGGDDNIEYDISGEKVTGWNHAVARYDGSEINLFVNGDRVTDFASGNDGSETQTLDTGDQHPFRLGVWTWDGEGDWAFDGAIDEAMVFSRALSNTEIQEIYTDGYEVYHDNDGTTGTYTQELEPGDTETVSVDWNVEGDAREGGYDAVTAAWTDDPANDGWQLDNEWNHGAFEVSEPEFQITSHFLDDPVIEGDTLQVDVDIENVGSTGDAEVEWWLRDDDADEWEFMASDIQTVAAGDTERFTFTGVTEEGYSDYDRSFARVREEGGTWSDDDYTDVDIVRPIEQLVGDGDWYDGPAGYAHDDDYAHDNRPIQEGERRTYRYDAFDSGADIRMHLRDDEDTPTGTISNEVHEFGTRYSTSTGETVEIEVDYTDASEVVVDVADGALVQSYDASTDGDLYWSTYEWAGAVGDNSLRLHTKYAADGDWFTGPDGWAHDGDYAHDNVPLIPNVERTYSYYERGSTADLRPHFRDAPQTTPTGGISNEIAGGTSHGIPSGEFEVDVRWNYRDRALSDTIAAGATQLNPHGYAHDGDWVDDNTPIRQGEVRRYTYDAQACGCTVRMGLRGGEASDPTRGNSDLDGEGLIIFDEDTGASRYDPVDGEAFDVVVDYSDPTEVEVNVNEGEWVETYDASGDDDVYWSTYEWSGSTGEDSLRYLTYPIAAAGDRWSTPDGFAHDGDWVHDNDPISQGEIRTYMYDEMGSSADLYASLRDDVDWDPSGGTSTADNEIVQWGPLYEPGDGEVFTVEVDYTDSSQVEVSVNDGEVVETYDASGDDDVYWSTYGWTDPDGSNSMRFMTRTTAVLIDGDVVEILDVSGASEVYYSAYEWAGSTGDSSLRVGFPHEDPETQETDGYETLDGGIQGDTARSLWSGADVAEPQLTMASEGMQAGTSSIPELSGSPEEPEPDPVGYLPGPQEPEPKPEEEPEPVEDPGSDSEEQTPESEGRERPDVPVPDPSESTDSEGETSEPREPRDGQEVSEELRVSSNDEYVSAYSAYWSRQKPDREESVAGRTGGKTYDVVFREGELVSLVDDVPENPDVRFVDRISSVEERQEFEEALQALVDGGRGPAVIESWKPRELGSGATGEVEDGEQESIRPEERHERVESGSRRPAEQPPSESERRGRVQDRGRGDGVQDRERNEHPVDGEREGREEGVRESGGRGSVGGGERGEGTDERESSEGTDEGERGEGVGESDRRERGDERSRSGSPQEEELVVETDEGPAAFQELSATVDPYGPVFAVEAGQLQIGTQDHDTTDTLSTTITVPSDAEVGETLLRVRTSRGDTLDDATATDVAGEVNDFTVFVDEDGTPPADNETAMIAGGGQESFTLNYTVQDGDGDSGGVDYRLRAINREFDVLDDIYEDEAVVGEPADFVINQVNTNDPVLEVADTLEVDAQITNEGDVTETQEVSIHVEGVEVFSQDITLGPDDSTTVTGPYETRVDDSPSVDWEVDTLTDHQSGTASVDGYDTQQVENFYDWGYEHTVVDWSWTLDPTQNEGTDACADEQLQGMDEYFRGNMGSSETWTVVGDSGDNPSSPTDTCMSRVEADDGWQWIDSSEWAGYSDQDEALSYYPERGDSIEIDFWVYRCDAEFDFRFGVDSYGDDDYYEVTVETQRETSWGTRDGCSAWIDLEEASGFPSDSTRISTEDDDTFTRRSWHTLRVNWDDDDDGEIDVDFLSGSGSSTWGAVSIDDTTNDRGRFLLGYEDSGSRSRALFIDEVRSGNGPCTVDWDSMNEYTPKTQGLESTTGASTSLSCALDGGSATDGTALVTGDTTYDTDEDTYGRGDVTRTSRGDRIRYMAYDHNHFSTEGYDEFIFGAQMDGESVDPDSSYSVGLSRTSADEGEFVLLKDNDQENPLASADVDLDSSTWYEVVVDWGTGDSSGQEIAVTLLDEDGDQIERIDVLDTEYMDGAVGYRVGGSGINDPRWDDVRVGPPE